MIKINLFPVKRTLVTYLCWISIFLFIVAFLLYGSLALLNHKIKIQLLDMAGQINIEIEEKEIRQKEYERAKKELDDINYQIGVLENMKDLAPILSKIATYLPEQIWLEKIQSNEKGKIFIDAQSSDFTQIMVWVERLKEVPEITGVDLLYFKGEQMIQFTIEIKVGD